MEEGDVEVRIEQDGHRVEDPAAGVDADPSGVGAGDDVRIGHARSPARPRSPVPTDERPQVGGGDLERARLGGRGDRPRGRIVGPVDRRSRGAARSR